MRRLQQIGPNVVADTALPPLRSAPGKQWPLGPQR